MALIYFWIKMVKKNPNAKVKYFGSRIDMTVYIFVHKQMCFDECVYLKYNMYVLFDLNIVVNQ